MPNKTLEELIKNTIIKGDASLENEINILFENIIKYNCSELSYISSPYSLIGTENTVSINVKYGNIVPNLFRKCWCDFTPLPLPNACPILYYSSISLVYTPIIIEEKIIKGFLYYGFSDELGYTVETKSLYERLVEYKRNIKYINSSSYYDIVSIIYNIFNKKSIFIKIFFFISYLNLVISRINNGKILNNYLIPWYCLNSCSCITGILTELTVSNLINKLPLDNNDFIFINNLIIENRNDYKIVLVIKYAKEVFNDVYNQIFFFLTSKKYCDKPYMNISLIPEVLEKYNNYIENLKGV
jgi:hypothetical protein